MLIDKYTSIDDFINKNERVLLAVVDLCDKLCSTDLQLKEIAQ
jgi:hypothetical protein